MRKAPARKKTYSASEKAAFARKMAYLRSQSAAAAPAPRARRTTVPRAPSTNVGKALRYAGLKAGGFLGGPAGAFLGEQAGAAISRIAGFGDYKVSSNSLLYPRNNDQIPSFGAVEGGIRVRHREYVADIRSSTAFVNKQFTINPSDPSLFPWLSSMAPLFEQWKPMGMIFEYKSLYSDAVVAGVGATGSLGAVVLATEYNALANRFTTKQQMENTQFVVSCKPSISCIHPVECARSQTPTEALYVRLDNAAAGDARLYDLGTFQIATQGINEVGAIIGELWVSYDIMFYKPVLDTVPAAYIYKGIAQNVQAGIAAGHGLLGNALQVQKNTLGITTNLSTVSFPVGSAGYYRVECRWVGVVATGAYDMANIYGSLTNCQLQIPPQTNPYSSAIGNNTSNRQTQIVPAGGGFPVVMSTAAILQVIDDSLVASFTLLPGVATGWPNDDSYGDICITYVGAVAYA